MTVRAIIGAAAGVSSGGGSIDVENANAFNASKAFLPVDGWPDNAPELGNDSFYFYHWGRYWKNISGWMGDLQFHPSDGTRAWARNGNNIQEWSLGTAYDVTSINTTAVATLTAPSSGMDPSLNQLVSWSWGNSGSTIYVGERYSQDIGQIPCSTAYDITTADTGSRTVLSLAYSQWVNCIRFSDDGTRMWVCFSSTLREFSLSTAWDITTASSVAVVTLFTSNEGGDFRWFNNGYNLLINDSAAGNGDWYIRPCSTAYDITTVGAATSQLTALSQSWPDYGGTQVARSFDFVPNSKKIIVAGRYANARNAATLIPAGMRWRQASNWTGDHNGIRWGGLRFNDDGTRCFHPLSGYIRQVDLNVPYDILSADITTTVNKVLTNMYAGLYWKDSTTFFTTHRASSHGVQKWTCSSAWDVSTATLSQTYNSAQYFNPTCIAFSNDGTTMFLGQEYYSLRFYYATLSTPWDLTTVGTQNYLSSGPFTNQYGLGDLVFSDDGYKAWYIGDTFENIYEVTMTNPFVVTSGTAEVSSRRFAWGTYGSSTSNGGLFKGKIRGICWSPLGSKLYLTHKQNGDEGVYQFDIDPN
jgi:hypothetical protein